jgi:hypothetical protein
MSTSTNYPRGDLRILTDKPLIAENDEIHDALRFRSHKNRLVEIIKNSDPRFAIGIFGSWGSGKTSFLNMMMADLDKPENKNDILTVWFDAWKYDREKHFALIHFIREFRINIAKKGNKTKWSIVEKGVKDTLTAFGESLKLSVPFYGPSINFDSGSFLNSIKSGKPISLSGEKVPMHQHPTEILAESIASQRKTNPKLRIVVFVDDLDRCTAEKALEVIESIKAFMDIEGVVFVIAMDYDSISKVIEKKFGDNTISGKDYLQKIVQVPFPIPTWHDGWEEDEITASISQMITSNLGDLRLAKELSKSENVKIMIKGIQLNPRQIKRFVNKVILSESVYGIDNELSITKLITVQIMVFRGEWRKTLDIITPDPFRKHLQSHFKMFLNKINEKDEMIRISIPAPEDIVGMRNKKAIKFINDVLSIDVTEQDISQIDHKDNIEKFYKEYVKQGVELQNFLNSIAGQSLFGIEQMSKYLKAVDPNKENLEFIDYAEMELSYECWRNLKRDAEFGGKKVYTFHVKIDATDAVLDKIEYVKYRLSAAWPDPIRIVTDRKTKFSLKELAWGNSVINAEVKVKGQMELIKLSHPIDLGICS